MPFLEGVGGKLTVRPTIELCRVTVNGKPTLTTLGAAQGYSLPVYNDDDEELFFRDFIPVRWNGQSDFTVRVKGYLSSAETVNDDFRLQLSWVNKAVSTGVMPATTTDVEVETNVDTGRNAQYSIYEIDFTIDWNLLTPNIASGDYFAGRLRRIAAEGTEIDGEFVVVDITIQYNVNKAFGQ